MEINISELEIEGSPISSESSVYKAMVNEFSLKFQWRGSAVAVKILETGLDETQLAMFKAEAAIHKKLRPHAAVVQFFGIVISPHQCMIVTECIVKIFASF